MSCLVVISGREKGRTCKVTPDHDTVVGRTADCDIGLADQRASRRHCVIVAGQAGFIVRDLGSANGTLLNGQRVKESPLKDGDKLTVGVTEMEFHQQERFEDAETKKLVGDEGLPPEAAVTAKRRKSKPRLDTQAIEFCARCSGSIPAGALAGGRARRADGQLLCAECLAGESGKAEAAKIGDDPRALAAPGRKSADDPDAVLEALTAGGKPADEGLALDAEGLPLLPADRPARPDPLADLDKTPVPRGRGRA